MWHMTLDKDKPLIITDGALNVLPNVKQNAYSQKCNKFSNRIGIEDQK